MYSEKDLMEHQYRREANKNVKTLLRKVFKTSLELKENYLMVKFIRHNFNKQEQKQEFGCTNIETEIVTYAAKKFIAFPDNRSLWYNLITQKYDDKILQDNFDGISKQKIDEAITHSLINKMQYSLKFELL